MNKTPKLHLWLGIAVGAIVSAAILFSIYYVPRKGINLGGEALSFTVVLKEAHGLHPGSVVLISGIEVGEVVDVRISPIPNLGYRVLVTVDIFDGEQYGPVLKVRSIYAVARSGLLGSMTVSITPGGPGPPLKEGMLVDGTAPMDLSNIAQDVGNITTRLADFMDGRNRGDPSLKRALKDLQALVRNLRSFSEKLPH